MAEYTIKELEQKFMNAHNAGDTKAAKLLTVDRQNYGFGICSPIATGIDNVG